MVSRQASMGAPCQEVAVTAKPHLYETEIMVAPMPSRTSCLRIPDLCRKCLEQTGMQASASTQTNDLGLSLAYLAFFSKAPDCRLTAPQ